MRPGGRGPARTAAGAPLLGLLVHPLAAAQPPPLRILVDEASGRAEAVVGDVLADDGLRRALESGLPVRLNLRVELWRTGFVDELQGRFRWWAALTLDPMEDQYFLRTGASPSVERVLPSLEAVRSALQDSIPVALGPEGPGRYYYLATLEVETLSLSDLEELQRWLRGELAPSVAGERDVEGALASGVRRLFMRLLGLPTRRFEARSPLFRLPPRRAPEEAPSPAGGRFRGRPAPGAR